MLREFLASGTFIDFDQAIEQSLYFVGGNEQKMFEERSKGMYEKIENKLNGSPAADAI